MHYEVLQTNGIQISAVWPAVWYHKCLV